MNSAQRKKPIHAGSTQRFTEIEDIFEDVVLLSGGNACMAIEIQASNFALLSMAEQQAKIYSYASLLNSLSFPIQIVIQNKKIDISSYLRLLDEQTQKTATIFPQFNPEQNQLLLTQVRLYRDFVRELVKVNSVLDKKFYIVIPYSYLEKTAAITAASVKGKNAKEAFFLQAKTVLHTKANSVISQLARVGLRAKTMNKEELIKLYFEIYNQSPPPPQMNDSSKIPVVKGQEAT